jgi:hypothetical protein
VAPLSLPERPIATRLMAADKSIRVDRLSRPQRRRGRGAGMPGTRLRQEAVINRSQAERIFGFEFRHSSGSMAVIVAGVCRGPLITKNQPNLEWVIRLLKPVAGSGILSFCTLSEKGSRDFTGVYDALRHPVRRQLETVLVVREQAGLDSDDEHTGSSTQRPTSSTDGAFL